MPTFTDDDFANFGAPAATPKSMGEQEFATLGAPPAATAKPSAGGELAKALTDIPHEIGRTLNENVDATKQHFSGATPNSSADIGTSFFDVGPTLRSIGETGKGILSAAAVPFSPIQGLYRSLLGHPITAADQALRDQAVKLHGEDKVRAAETAAGVKPGGIGYDEARELADTAMAATRPAGFTPRGPMPTVTKPPPPTSGDLLDAAGTNYKVARSLGVQMHQPAISMLADDIIAELSSPKYGFRERKVPNTFADVRELHGEIDPKTGLSKRATADISDLDSVRSSLNDTAANPAERRAARIAIDKIDEYLANVHPRDVAVNDHLVPELRQEINEARGNYAAGKRSQLIEGREEAAHDTAASTGSGANINNATRQKIRTILAPGPAGEKLRRGFNSDEIDQMRRIVRGTFTGNATRLLGKLAPSGIVSGALSAGLGHAAAGPFGIPMAWLIGGVAKKLGEASTARQLGRLNDMVRARSPLGRPVTTVPGAPSPAAAAPFLAGRLGAPYAPDEP